MSSPAFSTVAPPARYATGPRRPEPLDADLLHDIASGIGRATSLWRPLVRHDPAGRRPVRFLATDRYEVWVIGWLPGQQADLHDHGDAAGALHIVEGTLIERTRSVTGDRSTPLVAGTTLDLAVGLVHEVGNHHDGPASSIHVYSPPLETMTHYADDDRPTVTEIIRQAAPVLGGSADTILRHPSVRG